MSSAEHPDQLLHVPISSPTSSSAEPPWLSPERLHSSPTRGSQVSLLLLWSAEGAPAFHP